MAVDLGVKVARGVGDVDIEVEFLAGGLGRVFGGRGRGEESKERPRRHRRESALRRW